MLKITGMKVAKDMISDLERIPMTIIKDVLEDSKNEVIQIIKKYCPKDTGNSINSIQVIERKTDGESFAYYEIGFHGAKWNDWKGAYFQCFIGERSNFQHIGWLQHANKEVNKMLKSKLDRIIGKYLG